MTPRRFEILRWISDCARRNGYPPTIREIGAAFGIRSTNGVKEHLMAMEHNGYLLITAGRSRAMRVLREEP